MYIYIYYNDDCLNIYIYTVIVITIIIITIIRRYCYIHVCMIIYCIMFDIEATSLRLLSDFTHTPPHLVIGVLAVE